MIYTPDNTSGTGNPLKIYINGRLVDYAFYADTKKGKVRAYRKPFKMHKRKNMPITETYSGKVTVEAY